MKLSGPTKNMEATWEVLGRNIKLERPEGDSDNVHTFLGCTHRRTTRQIGTKTVECVEYDVQGSLKRSIAKYGEAVFDATGSYPKMKGERTPFITEETKYSKHRAPASNDDFVECPC